MAFNKHATSDERTDLFNLGNGNDRRIVDEFEKELAPYEARKVMVLRGFGKFERQISGFELYLHENGIHRYTTAYPFGAFVVDKLPEYRFLKLKMQALERLRESRKKAKEYQNDQVESLVAQAV